MPVEDTRPAEEVEKEARAAEAQSRAVVLEMIGDLPEADVKPPSNMLFVCKLNPVTTEEDLEIIFSRWGGRVVAWLVAGRCCCCWWGSVGWPPARCGITAEGRPGGMRVFY